MKNYLLLQIMRYVTYSSSMNTSQFVPGSRHFITKSIHASSKCVKNSTTGYAPGASFLMSCGSCKTHLSLQLACAPAGGEGSDVPQMLLPLHVTPLLSTTRECLVAETMAFRTAACEVPSRWEGAPLRSSRTDGLFAEVVAIRECSTVSHGATLRRCRSLLNFV